MIEIFKALSDENRLRILNVLLNHELCVCELEVVLGMTQSNVSRHLGKLKNLGIIRASKDAQWIHYKLNDTFAKENQLLIQFLILNFEKNTLMNMDLNRYKVYRESGYTCQTIRNDKNIVFEYISNGVSCCA